MQIKAAGQAPTEGRFRRLQRRAASFPELQPKLSAKPSTSTIEPTEKKPLKPDSFPDAPIQDRATEGAALTDEGEMAIDRNVITKVITSGAIHGFLIARESPVAGHPRTSSDERHRNRVRVPSPTSALASSTYIDSL